MRVAARSTRDQRRRQMADRHSGDAAFGLRRLARIADDERIDHRQRPGHDLRKTRSGQRHGLAGQPFQGAVRAHVNEGVDAGDLLQPQPERDQGVTRRQLRIVIIGAALRAASAIRWQRDKDIAESSRTKMEHAVAHIRIAGRLAPGLINLLDGRARHTAERGEIIVDRHNRVIATARQLVQQSAGRARRAGDVVSGIAQIVQRGKHAGGHVEANRVASAILRARIIRHQNCKAALAARPLRQAQPGGNTIGRDRHPVELNSACQRGEREFVAARQHVFEGDHAGQHPAIQFGQHDVHR